MKNFIFASLLGIFAMAASAFAQERSYFVTYTQHMEEPGNLEVATTGTIGVPRSGESAYLAPLGELEYGVTAWWTSEFYLESLSRRNDSTILTGFRFENRFRPIQREMKINPVVYFEYENINEASSVRKEIVGHAHSLDEPNAELRKKVARELEAKLILGSTIRDWNVSENFIVEKNLSEDEGYEFGYAFGVARPLATMASGSNCRFCLENFVGGVELYGGLGSSRDFGLKNTAQYFAPFLSWNIGSQQFRFSPAIGLTDKSAPALIRFGYSYEIHGFGEKLAAMFGQR